MFNKIFQSSKVLTTLLLTIVLGFCVTSCSKDDEPSNNTNTINSIVGTWYQINSVGTVITIQFNSNKTGTITYEYTSGNSAKEPFEYSVRTDSDQNMIVYISSADSQIFGEYYVYITPNTLTLQGYINGEYGLYPFNRK